MPRPTPHPRRPLVPWLVAVAAAAWAAPAPAQTLFYDDFTDAARSAGNWGVGTWQLGRTQLGNAPAWGTGHASLKLSTYNPGNTALLRGSEIYSNQTFALGATGVDFEARVRTTMTTPGAVTSFFTYSGLGTPASPAQEIDYEVLTKQLGGNRLLATTWKDWTGAGGQFNDGVHHRNNDPAASAGQPAGVGLAQWNTLRIRWLPTRTEWYLNNALFFSTPDAHPTAAMPIRLNFWAPDSTWAAAFDGGLAPATTLSGNTDYSYDVQYVKVSVVPVPEPAAVLAVAAVALAAARRRRV